MARENPLYGRIICRCETITEGEIVDAAPRPIPARSVDGVKRLPPRNGPVPGRLLLSPGSRHPRAGMGRALTAIEQDHPRFPSADGPDQKIRRKGGDDRD